MKIQKDKDYPSIKRITNTKKTGKKVFISKRFNKSIMIYISGNKYRMLI